MERVLFLILLALLATLYPTSFIQAADGICACYYDELEYCEYYYADEDGITFTSASECALYCEDEFGNALTRTDFAEDSDSEGGIDVGEACAESKEEAIALNTTIESAETGSLSSGKSLIKPRLSIDIPTVSFSDGVLKDKVLKVNYLGEYIAGVYKYLLGIATTIAIVMIMIGGLQWAFGGTSEEAITKAKGRIKNAVTGLILLLSTYLILYTVNPNLIKLQFPELDIIDFEPLISDSGDVSGSISWMDLEKKLLDIGIVCAAENKSSGDLSFLAQSFVGKVTYRFGGKGSDPPYSGEGTRKIGGESTSGFCPEGTVCMDCSGFADTLRQCAGLQSSGENGGTAGIFASAESITKCGDGYVSTKTKSIDLEEGDLVGYKPGDRADQPKFGHVWMYIGHGKVISAMGGDSGRQAGNAVQIQSLADICKKYPLRLVER
jgi:hypothetical protein